MENPHVRVTYAGWHRFILQLPELPDKECWYALRNLANEELKLTSVDSAPTEFRLQVKISQKDVQQITFLGLDQGKITRDKIVAAATQKFSTFIFFSFRMGKPE